MQYPLTNMNRFVLTTFALLALAGCKSTNTAQMTGTPPGANLQMDKYTTVRLTTDLSALSDRERQMIPLLIEAAQAMDEVFQVQAYGNLDSLLAATRDPETRRFIQVNYGPWDRLEGNAPFIAGVGPKPAGANFYPRDMTKEEFEAEVAKGGPRADSLKSLYTIVRRGRPWRSTRPSG